MKDVAQEIQQTEKELSVLPVGYLSRKVINGKERFYLQWNENGKIKSKYVKENDLSDVKEQVERRKELQTKLKELRSSPEGIKNSNLRRKAARNMIHITGELMSGDDVVASVKNGEITDYDADRIPLYLKRTKDMETWLASRAIDPHRTNSRLLKKALRIRTTDDAQAALAVNAATITDNYWFRPEGSSAVYEDIRFKENYFSDLALRGDPDSFSKKPSRTPELTNVGSYEKCWKLIDGEWWMYKSGKSEEYFSELFICKLGETLNLDIAHYEMDNGYIRTKNFLSDTKLNFEPMSSLTDDDDYANCFEILSGFSEDIAKQYLMIVWFDTLCYNMDRHTANFGLLRNAQTGKIVSMAPNYDNNIALISRGYPADVTRKKDGLLRLFKEFVRDCPEVRELYRRMDIPEITEEIIRQCLDDVPIKENAEYITAFILNGQSQLREMLWTEDMEEDDGESFGMML